MFYIVIFTLLCFTKTALSETADTLKWIPFRSKMYHFPSTVASPFDALVYCENIVSKGHLAVLNDPDVRNFLLKHIPKPPALTRPYKYHIGLLQINSSFSWIDGSKYKRTSAWWAPGEPKKVQHLINYISMGSENQYDPNFSWKVNAVQGDKAHYICERPNVNYDLESANTHETTAHTYSLYDRITYRLWNRNMVTAALEVGNKSAEHSGSDNIVIDLLSDDQASEDQNSSGFSLFGLSSTPSILMIIAGLSCIIGVVVITTLVVKIQSIRMSTRSSNLLSSTVTEERRVSGNAYYDSSSSELPEVVPPSGPEVKFFDSVANLNELRAAAAQSTSAHPRRVTIDVLPPSQPSSEAGPSSVVAVGSTIVQGLSAMVPTSVTRRLSALSISSLAATIVGPSLSEPAKETTESRPTSA